MDKLLRGVNMCKSFPSAWVSFQKDSNHKGTKPCLVGGDRWVAVVDGGGIYFCLCLYIFIWSSNLVVLTY